MPSCPKSREATATRFVSSDRTAEFPKTLGDEVKIILPRGDGSYYRACPKCTGELDIEVGEWVAMQPDNHAHGYLISQLVSSMMDPGEILSEYEKTRFPER